MQAIQSATVGGADLLGIADRAGSIKQGKLADVIAVRGDPLSNVRLLEDVPLRDETGRNLQAGLVAAPRAEGADLGSEWTRRCRGGFRSSGSPRRA